MADTIAPMDGPPESLPVGRFGQVEAIGLEGPDGDHAILVRQADAHRLLLTSDSRGSPREHLVVTPLDDDVDVRVDGDALAVWLASAPITHSATSPVPGWASVAGLVLLLLVVAFTIIGGAVALGWVVELLGR
jgi:hypothetical protein